MSKSLRDVDWALGCDACRVVCERVESDDPRWVGWQMWRCPTCGRRMVSRLEEPAAAPRPNGGAP